MPGRTVAIRAVAAMQTTVKPTKKRLRAPAWSATPPSSGEVSAPMTMAVEMAEPHRKSPRPVSLPTTRFAKYAGYTVDRTIAANAELAKSYSVHATIVRSDDGTAGRMTQPRRVRYYPRHAGPDRSQAARAARPERRRRHGADRVPRYLRPAHGQAGRRQLLPRSRRGRRRPRLHLPLHGRHGNGAAARLQADVMGARLRGHEDGPRPGDPAAHFVAAEDRAGLLRRLHRGGRADRGGAAVGSQAPDRARSGAGLRRQDRRRARALLLQGVVRGGAAQASS